MKRFDFIMLIASVFFIGAGIALILNDYFFIGWLLVWFGGREFYNRIRKL